MFNKLLFIIIVSFSKVYITINQRFKIFFLFFKVICFYNIFNNILYLCGI